MFFKKPEAKFKCLVDFLFETQGDLPWDLEETIEQWLCVQTHLRSGALSEDLVSKWNYSRNTRCFGIRLKITEMATEQAHEVADTDDCQIDVKLLGLHLSAPECVAVSEDDKAASLPALKQWFLPHLSLLNVWQTLHYDDNDALKTQLLEYAQASMKLSGRHVSSTIIHSSRLVILHGPPGVGKTSLCRGLAQELSERKLFAYPYLVEVNAAALFSKYFSESGKTVSRVFNHIEDLAENGNTDPEGEGSIFVCVLFDEVETLSISRQSAANSGENMETLRVVNAMLTQLDALMMLPNVLVVCTTNLLSALDPAFVDRADLVLNLGLPGETARRKILMECLDELRSKGIIDRRYYRSTEELENAKRLRVSTGCSEEFPPDESVPAAIQQLVIDSSGCSARQLRKLPLHGFARLKGVEGVKTIDFIKAMAEHLEEHKRA